MILWTKRRGPTDSVPSKSSKDDYENNHVVIRNWNWNIAKITGYEWKGDYGWKVRKHDEHVKEE